MRKPPKRWKTCPLCGREIPPRRESRHHLVPKSRGGREIVILHTICHNKLHSVLTEKELEREYPTIEKLLGHEEIARFAKWIAGKPPEFHSRTRRRKA